MFKSGYVSVVGKPNAGKSTLVNKLVGFKVAITTPKPQTTRFNIKGIVTSKSSQIVFIDTPGVHTPKHKMGKYMMENVNTLPKKSVPKIVGLNLNYMRLVRDNTYGLMIINIIVVVMMKLVMEMLKSVKVLMNILKI